MWSKRLWQGMEQQGECLTFSCSIFLTLNPLDRLYRGVVPPLLGVTPMFAVSFWVCYPIF